ncbi:flagellar biosynthesis protein FlhA [Limimaricola soesokkakensis]|uniref:Flagellar biosynthesis protein FlhA n=1 Tax=Limimaricola soesokkakensis TaxID=1343159 RepID=A0A1X7A1I2_9RHOB|nr:flagellar biosynthesis protein FlhA [Limimaricola soesokkakensis]PSK81189.1 flagellar biosynthesis protein FlhA [Limimaricola soesokkakensis]SLN67999.1 Flagellar biosynthesis protein FlhA [Limimaricola soesokkakensis]
MSSKPTGAKPPSRMLALGLANRDVGFALGVTAVLAVLFVPLPSVLLDLGLAISLALSALILMVALWIPKPLEFNSFPTLLLVVTMLRLSLNVASTRLILSQGHTGPGAAGGVIEGFSRFIVAGSFVIGIVIFAILVVINFIVISKGSTRIAEVAARFSLDAMPGKQMAIDADLGAGLIDEAQAKTRRKELEDESGFFGAMDGASKFVRGDAVAGLIITMINIVGGILIGVVQHGLPIGEAANVYTTLTIGDGLVSQIPALIVSLAAGLIVTKGGTEGAANEAVLGQLGKFPKALYMAAGLLCGIGLLPGFPLPVFVILASMMAGLGYVMDREAKARVLREAAQAIEGEQAEAKTPEDDVQETLKLDDLRLDLGGALVPLINRPDAALPGKIKSLRHLFAREFGFVLPSVRIKDDPALASDSYAITVQGVAAATAQIRATGMMVINPAEAAIELPGPRTKDPTFGLEVVWVDQALADQAEAAGCTVVDPESVITTHLTEVIKQHMPELLTYGAVQQLIEGLPRPYQKLAGEISGTSPTILVQHVLQALLLERISIRNLPLIVEAIAEAGRTTSSVTLITEHVRRRLSNQICHALTDAQGFVPVITMSSAWETEFNGAVRMNGEERNFLMSPQRVQEFVLEARKEIQRFAQADEWPALMVSPEVRGFVRSMLERVSPMTQVISHNEVHRKAALRTVATIGG